MSCSKITSGGRFGSTDKLTPAKIPPTMMRIVKLNIYIQNMDLKTPDIIFVIFSLTFTFPF